MSRRRFDEIVDIFSCLGVKVVGKHYNPISDKIELRVTVPASIETNDSEEKSMSGEYLAILFSKSLQDAGINAGINYKIIDED